jgi:hypothetical protein
MKEISNFEVKGIFKSTKDISGVEELMVKLMNLPKKPV